MRTINTYSVQLLLCLTTHLGKGKASVIDLICSFSYCQQELGKTWEDIQNENEEEDKTDSSAGEE